MTLSKRTTLTLQELSRRLEALEHADTRGAAGLVPTGIAPIDAAIAGGLRAGAVHEWIGVGGGVAGGGVVEGGSGGEERRWSPALGLLTHVARRTAEAHPGGWVVWVGERVWPYPRVLAGRCDGSGKPGGGLLARSLFVRAQDAALRLWAADVALRCGAVACVVADGKAFGMGASRRLQLAANAGRTLGLLARPPTDEASLSAASTRWRVGRCAPGAPSHNLVGGTGGCNPSPRWIVELMRCKGVQPAPEAPRRWVVEWRRETGDISLVADVVGGSDHASETSWQRYSA